MSRTVCDLHVHSTASSANDEWYSRDFGCPESFATPRRQYELCKARGMSLVTLTDHDTIRGGLELVDQPDFFLSEEITAAFPEDGCVIHILAWNITPAQHDRLQCARPSVYDVVDVLRREKIVHACAHPLFSPNQRLSVAAFERMLVLFPIVESINGLIDRRLERNLSWLLAGLDEPTLDTIAGRHGLARPSAPRGRVAGSDAHAEACTASAFTAVDGVVDVVGFFDAIAAGQASAHGRSADLDTINATVSRVTYGYLAERRLERPSYRDPFVDLVDVVAGREHGTDAPMGVRDELVQSMLRGAARTRAELGPHLDLDGSEDVIGAMRRVHDGLIGRAFEELAAGVNDLDMYRVMGGIRDLAGAVATAIPFLFAANHFAAQRRQASDVLAQWSATPRPPDDRCLAIFSDTIDHVDGVTSSLRSFVRREIAQGRNVRIPYCGARPAGAEEYAETYAPLSATTTRGTSLYDGLDLHVPSPLATIEWLWRHEITHVELATPGPMGIIGMFAARLLRIPVTASYHTDIPELLRYLTGSSVMYEGANALAAWFYRSVDRVSAFSEASFQRLLALGVPADRIELVPVAIDTDAFSPAHASHDVFRTFGIEAPCERIILTVGRLSREKNVPLIIEAVGRLQNLPQPPVLVVVGDGPERDALSAMCANRSYVVFVGLQQGETLKRLYATASAFAFASRIDTLGLAPMEAMASGLPVIVPAGTGIAELVASGVTGAVYEFGLDGLVDAIEDVLRCPTRRASLARAARAAMVMRAHSTPPTS